MNPDDITISLIKDKIQNNYKESGEWHSRYKDAKEDIQVLLEIIKKQRDIIQAVAYN